MTIFRRLRKWWLCRKYGICPIHLTLMIGHTGYGGTVYHCDECARVNQLRHEHLENNGHLERVNACERVRILDAGQTVATKVKEGA